MIARVFIIIILLMFSLLRAGAGDSSRERVFMKALEAFDAAKNADDFRNVAGMFESLVSPDFQNDAVYYNIGNARIKAGEYGRAILAYRKARAFRPRDPWLEANLKQALDSRPGRVPEEPRPWWRAIFFWSDWLSYTEKFNLALAAWAASALALGAAEWKRSRRLRWAAAVLAGFAILFSADAWNAEVDLNQSGRAAVIAETVARKGNGLNWEPAFDQPLKDGAEFKILERRGDWVKGRFFGIGDAWLPAASIAE